MDEMSKNMSFEYDKEPKFREQETGHVYFDTEKLGSLVPRTYTSADASIVTNIGGTTVYKVCDFKTKDELIGWTIKIGNTVRLLDDSNIQNIAHTVEGYSGEYILGLGTDGGAEPLGLSIDASFEAQGLAIPEPGVYIYEDVSLDGFEKVEPDPFSKNVSVKAHVENTYHTNNASNKCNAYVIHQTESFNGRYAPADGSFDIAKEIFKNGGTVLIATMSNDSMDGFLYYPVVEHTLNFKNQYGEALIFLNNNHAFLKDGRLMRIPT